ncbi:MAG TPA: hypothetical protein HPP80_03065 [Rhodospirillaceae bacterium]|nr:hypothetical protein [Rhodospirillaceae bacterium]
MTDSGPFGLSHFSRVHHRYRRRHGLPWWSAFMVIAIGGALWLLPGWR